MNYIEQFEKYLREQNRSQHTIKAYLSDLKLFAAWLEKTCGEKSLDPAVITKLDVAHYKTYLTSEVGRKPAGVNRALSAIVAFGDWGHQRGWIKENPAQQIAWVKQVKAPPKALSELELNRLMREAYKVGNRRDIAMVELMAGAGLRIGEIEALNVADIEMSERKGMVTVRQGKGGKYRQVPLNKDARKALEEYIETRKQAEAALFLSQKGGRLSSNAIWKVIKKYGDKVGLNELTPHALRHTFATMLIRKHKIDLVTTAALLGHESIATTAIYTKPNQQDMIDAVEKLSKW